MRITYIGWITCFVNLQLAFKCRIERLMGEKSQAFGISTENTPVRTSSFVPVDLIRTVAIFLVILLHVSIESVVIPETVSPITAWYVFDFYNSIARPCVPLFVMLTGYLLLQPSKVNEPLKVFFKKRWARIGLPFIFWSIIYFAWVTVFDNGTFSASSYLTSMLQGPYVIFWYLYMLIGLYLLTPILRVFIAYASDHVMKLLLAVWFVGTGLVPLAALMGFNLNGNVFILPGWIGYFLLGSFLPKLNLKPRRWKLYGLMGVGFSWTMIGSIMTEVYNVPQIYFFFDYLTANVIVASVAMFLLLTSISTASYDKLPSKARRAIQTIGANSLPIYLFHMLLLETFRRGLLGFNLTIMTFDPTIMTPVLALIIFALSTVIVVALKKIPGLKRIIG